MGTMLKPDFHLRSALDRLPKSDGMSPPIVTVQVPIVDLPEARMGEGHTPKAPTTLPVEFHRGELSIGGKTQPVWVFEGAVTLDGEKAPKAHTPEAVRSWLRDTLGPRCIAVEIEDVHEHDATVKVAATT